MNILFEKVSKFKIIEEYGNSFESRTYEIKERFGKSHWLISKQKFDAVALLEDNITQQKESLNKKIKILKDALNVINTSFILSIVAKKKKREYEKLLEEYLVELEQVDNRWPIKYIEDKEYIIPAIRLHEGQDVYIIDFFMKSYEPVLKVLKVNRVDIAVFNKYKIEMNYYLSDDETLVSYNDNVQLTTNYNDRFIYASKKDALEEMKHLISERIEMLKKSEALIVENLIRI